MRHLPVVLADRLLLAADDDAVAVGQLEVGEPRADRVGDLADRRDSVMTSPVMRRMRFWFSRRIVVGPSAVAHVRDVAQVHRRAADAAREERDGAEVLGAR